MSHGRPGRAPSSGGRWTPTRAWPSSRARASARRLTAGTASARLDARALDAAEAVIVGAPEALGADEVALLDRYVRTRGGVLVLAPDRAVSGPAARWLDTKWDEHLTPEPQALGPLQATEFLVAQSSGPLDQVLARSPRGPVVVLAPKGDGRIVISGAMDAWRYRAESDAAFDRFWRAIVVNAASQSAPLSIEVGESVAVPGADVPILVRRRAMEPPASTTIRARARCGTGGAEPLRLWPAGELGVFTGALHIPGDGALHDRGGRGRRPGRGGGLERRDGARSRPGCGVRSARPRRGADRRHGRGRGRGVGAGDVAQVTQPGRGASDRRCTPCDPRGGWCRSRRAWAASGGSGGEPDCDKVNGRRDPGDGQALQAHKP